MTASLSLADPAVRRDVERLAPYARAVIERAADHAHRLHAEEVSSEHVLTALFHDETAGATRLVLHAFADPETLAIELLALSPGIMVVGSGRSLPFSMRAIEALEAARAGVAEARGAGVDAGAILAAAVAALPGEQRTGLAAAGLALDGAAAAEPSATPVPPTGPLFHHFTPEARRALGAACRAAAQWQRATIGPAHLVLGALEADPALAERVGLPANRARMVLGGRDEDTTPLDDRALAPDEDLARLLGALEDGADSVALLGHVLSRGNAEVRQLLARQKITWALFQRVRHAFGDPEV